MTYSIKAFGDISEKLKSIGWNFSYTKAEAKQVRNQKLDLDMDTVPWDRTLCLETFDRKSFSNLFVNFRSLHVKVEDTGDIPPAIKAQIEKADAGMSELMKDSIEVHD